MKKEVKKAFLLMLVIALIASRGSLTIAQTCSQPPSGMVSWWPGEGNAFDIADGNPGTPMNGATFAPGMVGQAFSFDGEDDFVQVASLRRQRHIGDFTGWKQHDTYQKSFERLLRDLKSADSR